MSENSPKRLRDKKWVFTCPNCTSSTRSMITVYEKIQRGNSTIYRPRQIPRPLTLMERLRIARAKVHAEQAKKNK